MRGVSHASLRCIHVPAVRAEIDEPYTTSLASYRVEQATRGCDWRSHRKYSGQSLIMSTTTATASLAIQPWTRDNAGDNSLPNVLARAKYERGHFRDITEASLQEEIAAEGALELSESDLDEEDGEDGADVQKADSKPASHEDLLKAKAGMMKNVAAAEEEVLMALDFVSLLLSKDAPKQASTTVSPLLKSILPLGTLGTDLWQKMPVDKAREAQDELLATTVRMQGLQQSADDLLTAASRLQDNVQRESQYWNQVLSIFEEGWNVCRIPGQPHRLGVRYGFSESSPEFSRRGIAALNPSSDGNITLERGIGSGPEGAACDFAQEREDRRYIKVASPTGRRGNDTRRAHPLCPR